MMHDAPVFPRYALCTDGYEGDQSPFQTVFTSSSEKSQTQFSVKFSRYYLGIGRVKPEICN